MGIYRARGGVSQRDRHRGRRKEKKKEREGEMEEGCTEGEEEGGGGAPVEFVLYCLSTSDMANDLQS